MNGEDEKTGTTTSRLRAMTELERYGCGPIQFTGANDALYERHLLFDNVIDLATVGPRESYEAVARSVRDVSHRRLSMRDGKCASKSLRHYGVLQFHVIG